MAKEDQREDQRPVAPAGDAALRADGWATRRSLMAPVHGLAGRLWLWLGATIEREYDSGTAFHWLPVALGLGILIYFAAPAEPWAPALLGLAAALWIAVWLSRARHGLLLQSLIMAAVVVTGGAVMKTRTDRVAAPVIEHQTTGTLTGWVEARDARRGGYRLTIRVVSFEGRRTVSTPERVTVTVRGASVPQVGDGVTMLAQLRPPSGPALPGSYDFGQAAFFRGVGATGFAYGAAKPADLGPAPLGVRLMRPLENLREVIRAQILAALPGDTARVASALIIGDAGGISEAAEDDLRQSGLAHILSVSGLHMVLVAGAVFWSVRALLALFPALALRRPIKKWAALAALGVTGFYLLISGLDVAAQRSFIMMAIAFLAVLLDRRAISMRNVAVAALIVLILVPESLLSASFQMSFAATVALVAGFEALSARPRPIGPRPERGGIGALVRGAFVVVSGLIVTSLLGGLGSTPFALYHFQRMAPLSILANVLAMPLTDFIVMPLALVSVLLMPFGFAAPFLKAMGFGIDGMLSVARMVSEWSAGTGGAAMPSALSLLIFVAGFLWLALMCARWRLAGLIPMLIGGTMAFTPDRPDIIVAPDGRMIAIRVSDGHYRVVAAKRDSFISGIWLRSDGDGRDSASPELAEGIACDSLGCVGHFPGGDVVALSLARPAFDEDCRRALIIVSPLEAPPACPRAIAVIDRETLARTGAISLKFRAERATALLDADDATRTNTGPGLVAISRLEAPGSAATGPPTPAAGALEVPPTRSFEVLAAGDHDPLAVQRTAGDEDFPPPSSGDDRPDIARAIRTVSPIAALDQLFFVKTAYPISRRPWMPALAEAQ